LEKGIINYQESCNFSPKQEKGKSKSFSAAKPKYEKLGLKNVRPQIFERKVIKKLRQKNLGSSRCRSIFEKKTKLTQLYVAVSENTRKGFWVSTAADALRTTT
jgi:hypothetical protein